MRIGELLVASSIIDAKALEKGLNYALDKRIPVGRALRALKYIEEGSLIRGLDAQKAILKGLDAGLAVEVLHYAEQTNRLFLDALRTYPGMMRNKIPPGFIQMLEGGALEQTKVQARPDLSSVTAGGAGASQIGAAGAKAVSKPPAAPLAAATGNKVIAPSGAAAAAPIQADSGKSALTAASSAGGNSPEPAPLPAANQKLAAERSAAPSPPIASQKPGKSAEDLVAEGDHLFAENKCLAAERSYELAFRLLETQPEAAPAKVVAVILKLAHLYGSMDKPQESEPLYLRALEIQTRLFGKDSAQVAFTLSHLADAKAAQGQADKAQAMLQQALFALQTSGSDDVQNIARLLHKLNGLLGKQQPPTRCRVGELACDAGLVTDEDVQAAVDKGESMGQPLGVVLRTEKRLNTQQVESLLYAQMLIQEGAICQPVAVRSLAIACAMKVPLRRISECGQWLASTTIQDEGYKNLVFECERLVAAETTLGAEHPELVPIIMRLGDLYSAKKERTAGELMYKRALRILDKWETDTRQMIRACEKLAQNYCQQGKFADAQPLLARSFDLRKGSGQGDTAEAAKCVWLMGKVEMLLLNPATAHAFFQNAKEMFARLQTPCPKGLLEGLLACINETRSTDNLEAVLQELIALVENAEDGQSAAAAYMEQLGDHHAHNGRSEQARHWYRQSLDIYERSSDSFERMQALSRKLSEVSLLL